MKKLSRGYQHMTYSSIDSNCYFLGLVIVFSDVNYGSRLMDRLKAIEGNSSQSKLNSY